MNKQHMPRIAFFGTPLFAEWILDAMEAAGYTPALVVTAPDKPRGRKLILTPPETKLWATERNIPVLQPESIRGNSEFITELRSRGFDLFVVAAYGKIIPAEILAIPANGTLNVHPSLLPEYRGPSPIESAILGEGDMTGVTIMLMDEEMDHGPILTQEVIPVDDWPPKGSELTKLLADEGGRLLCETITDWLAGNIVPQEQDHDMATYTSKIVKADGEIKLDDDPIENYKKIRAYDKWPGAYFFLERDGRPFRVRVIDATLADDGTLTITRVIPEGKKEMSYEDLMRNFNGK